MPTFRSPRRAASRYFTRTLESHRLLKSMIRVLLSIRKSWGRFSHRRVRDFNRWRRRPTATELLSAFSLLTCHAPVASRSARSVRMLNFLQFRTRFLHTPANARTADIKPAFPRSVDGAEVHSPSLPRRQEREGPHRSPQHQRAKAFHAQYAWLFCSCEDGPPAEASK